MEIRSSRFPMQLHFSSTPPSMRIEHITIYGDGIEPDIALPEPVSQPDEVAQTASQAALSWQSAAP